MESQSDKLDLKIGNYIRTKNGRIRKIISLYDTSDVFVETHSCIKQENIVLSSSKIIDLIEVGDYVNGEKVAIIEDDYVITEAITSAGIDGRIIYKTDIKSIVTKEDFKKMGYKTI